MNCLQLSGRQDSYDIVILRPGVNFTNVLHAAFTYVSCVRSFFVLTFQVCTLLAQDCWRKSCAQNIDEIEPKTLVTQGKNKLFAIIDDFQLNITIDITNLFKEICEIFATDKMIYFIACDKGLDLFFLPKSNNCQKTHKCQIFYIFIMLIV